MAAIWTGSLSFGLINIPVSLYSGSESRGGIELNMLHKEDLSPIRYARICRLDGKEVPFAEIVKGYEYRKGDYVILTDKDFQSINAAKTSTIDIEEFTEESQIDVRYYEKPYYLEPGKGADKAYGLLREALTKSQKVAIARFVLRNREHIAALKPVGKLLVLEQLRFPADLRQPSRLNVPDAKTSKKELDMALQLIDHLSQPFIPEDFRDTYTDELEKAIEAKVKGRKPKSVKPATVKTESADLLSSLKASLQKEHSKV
jgi:DNA end-binding protein Ku